MSQVVPGDFADLLQAVGGRGTGDDSGCEHGVPGAEHLPGDRQGGIRRGVVVDHVDGAAEGAAGRLAGEVGPIHHHLDRVERLLQGEVALLLLAVVPIEPMVKNETLCFGGRCADAMSPGDR